jgi:hypothetical protein
MTRRLILIAFPTITFLLNASITHANIVVTGVTVSPNPVGVNDTVTISVSGYINTVPAGQSGCTGVEIFFGDSQVPSTDPYKPAAAFVRMLPTASGQFPLQTTHQYSSTGMFTIIASAVSQYNGNWYHCGGYGNLAELTVLGDTIQSVKSFTPAVVNQQTSVVVKGLGSCSQNVQVSWGDGTTATIAGPVDLKAGGIASHTYASTGAKTVTASGSVCDGTATTTVTVALLDRPGQMIDPNAVQNLRNRLDRFGQLPPPPRQGGGPPCPICEGLAAEITLLDKSGTDLKLQSNTALTDLGDGRGRGVAGTRVARDLIRQLDRYFALRTQLLKDYTAELERSDRQKAR